MQNTDQNNFTDVEINNFMRMALEEAQKGFYQDQVPVGCIFFRKKQQNQYQIIAKNHNLTNKYKNATRHCQINCIYQMERLNQSQKQNLILFVTVEPCIMCSYALNIFGVKFVYFGQFNDKFGGCGSVLSCNKYPFKGGILERQSLQLIKKFYERGNTRITEQMRNKKRKKNKVQNQQKR